MKTNTGNIVDEYRYDDQGNTIYRLNYNTSLWLSKDSNGNEICRITQAGGMASEFEYDDMGRIVASYIIDTDYSFTYEYSPDGLHMKVVLHSNDGSKPYMEVDYDGKGHIIRETSYILKGGPTISTWEYNENGKLIEKEENNFFSDGRTTYEYDENGYLIHTTNYNVGITDYTYIRDEGGKLLEQHCHLTSRDGVESEWDSAIYEYNNHGDLARVFNYFSGAESKYDWHTVTYYLYDYDNADPFTDRSFKAYHQ